MASLQSDLADPSMPAAAASAGSGDCSAADGIKVKLSRRSLGGLAFEIQFDDAAGDGDVDSPSRKAAPPPPPPRALVSSAGGNGSGNNSGTGLSSEEIAERLAAAELRREQQLAQRMEKLESKLTHVSEVSDRLKREAEERAELNLRTVDETQKAAEERRLRRIEEVKQKARCVAERGEVVREHKVATKAAALQSLEVEMEKDIKEKEARRKEQLEKIVQTAQQHLAKVEGVRAHRPLSGGSDAQQE